MEQNQFPAITSRIWAYFIDSFLYSLLFFGLLLGLRKIYLSSADYVTILTNPEISGAQEMLSSGISILHFFIIFFICSFINLGGLFSWIVVWAMKGSSPGKKMFRLKIVKENQQPLIFRDIFIREFLMKGICSIISSGLFSLVSLFIGFYRKDGKTLQDIAAETIVISTKEERKL